jgi:integrase/recombinase XerD
MVMEQVLSKMSSCMQVREMSLKTRQVYEAHVTAFARFCGRCPSELGAQDVERYLLHLSVDKHLSSSTRNQCASALRFLYRVVLDRADEAERIPMARKQQRLPDVLSGSEVLAVLAGFTSVLHRTIALVCYGAGLRVSEACRLCIKDVDSKRQVLHVRCAKGNKDRQVTLGPSLLYALRACWKARRPSGPYLFEGNKAGIPLNVCAFQKALTAAARKAGVGKRVSPHVLRHSYATHMMEAGADLRSLQLQLGHSSISSTIRYVHLTHARRKGLPSPLDLLVGEQGQLLG